MPRDPQPFPMTLDGNLLKFRNELRIRDLLAVMSRDEVAAAIEGKVDGATFDAAIAMIGFVKNETTGNYHRLRCRNNADGIPELFLSDETYSF
jgi:hypothetical protein